MNEQLMFDEIKKLCEANGLAIYKIAKDTGIPCNLVAKMFMSTMNSILKKVEQQGEKTNGSN